MCKHSFCLLLCDALRRTQASESPGAGEEALSLRQIMEAQSFKVECSASPCRILATMALSLPLSVPSSPLLSTLPNSDEHPGISEAVTRGPTLSCERKPRNECHSLEGAVPEWQQNNGGRYERRTVHKHTRTRTSSNTFL